MEVPHPYRRPFTGTPGRGRGNHPQYLCEWGAVVGDRIRRLRRERGLTLVELARTVAKPEGGHYSPAYLSRIERGWTNRTLYAYLAIAAALGTDPGKLLGSDGAAVETEPAEAVLLRWMRGRGVESAAGTHRRRGPLDHANVSVSRSSGDEAPAPPARRSSRDAAARSASA